MMSKFDLKQQHDEWADRMESVTDQAAVEPVTRFLWQRTVICEVCRRDFYPKRKMYGVKYCSNACRQKRYRQNKI